MSYDRIHGQWKYFEIISEKNHHAITSELRLRWAKQAAEGLQILHSVDVVHCDVSPRNFLLDSGLNLKISDFAGASLSGSEPSAYSATRFSTSRLQLGCYSPF
ncbi:Serine/threonine protein kinase [Rasamsonia emersonii CBS 393.64]|uniref:EKC/KEOPS complex subunit BUD32 n=1 Tax=Rasamsonia emersonii (strain ATCC 16479 / CBS 393.64 / IMI 116815) TaxID=1408163 RepID=A0A0F4YE25_RASE3|nr:Serine/threonine protein kinase [Rasamsonia emersonii CBS 393.64]KKA16437.1 Serine/threonine protein kinase [Rasamsonia emersonii CBS 393.64]